ncbi:uncharacterized protein LOC143610319 [Bidens hawaiensis]|uniref:uncharacterized protein LOC143610319 n=1 Tax=Bidens hawaiensis TaxID=980011 RepID=UPI004049F24D
MKFFQSSSSESQLPKLKTARNCLPGVLHRLPCFHDHASHHQIKDLTEPLYVKTNPRVVARLMGLDSLPQRIPLVHHQQDHGNLTTRIHPSAQSPMILEIKKGKFFVLGFESRCKGKRESRSDSKRKLVEDDASVKRKRVTETLKSNAALKETSKVDFELGFLDQLILELVYVF